MPVGSEIDQEFPNARQPNGLFRGSGTSQSTAIVSGLAALYLQSHPSASPLQVKSAIRDSASSIGGGKSDGQGLVTVPNGNYGSNDTRRAEPEPSPVVLDRTVVGRPVHRRRLRRTPLERPSLERLPAGTPVAGQLSASTPAVGLT